MSLSLTNSHPFRLTLPVAPRAVASSRFTSGEKPPPALSPVEALAWLDERLAQGATIDAVEIAGPGEPMATVDITMETLELVRRRYPALKCSVTSLGLSGDQKVKDLADHGVSHLTLLMDAVEAGVVQRLYRWIRPARKTIPLDQAAGILLSEQASCLAACARSGLPVTVRTTVYPGINDHQVEEIARHAAALGAAAMIILPGLPVSDGEDTIPAPDLELMRAVRALAAKHLPVLEVRAGAEAETVPATPPSAVLPMPSRERANVAVVSASGMEVDLHLGQATRVMIYGPREDGLISLLGTRVMPEAGGGSSRWQRLAKMLPDCFALLAASAGDNPRAILRDCGIAVLITEGEIEGTVDVLYGGGKQSKCRKERPNP